jgi:hypothetical protein
MSNMDLEMLEVDKNAFLKSRLDPNLVRTGTVAEGSCFFHSVMKGMNVKYSKNDDGSVTTKKEKKEMAKKLREKVSESVTLEVYLSLYDGVLAKLEFSENVHKILNEFYNFVENTEEFIKDSPHKKFITMVIQNNLCFYKILVKLVNYDQMDKIHSGVFDTCNVIDCGKSWTAAIVNYIKDDSDLEEKTIDEIIARVDQLVTLICDTSIGIAHKNYKKKLADCSAWADNSMFKLVSDYLDIDIYILTEESGLPYLIPGSCDNMTSGKRDAVIVGSLGESHFESIGFRTESSSVGRGKIMRVFHPNHPLIKKMRAIYCDPGMVIREYPDFVDLIPKWSRS